VSTRVRHRFKIHFVITLFQAQDCAHVISPMHAIYLNQLIILDVITTIMFSEQFKLCNCLFLQHQVTDIHSHVRPSNY
jgi:hypothetical protein